MKMGRYVMAAVMAEAVQRFRREPQENDDWLDYVFDRMAEGVESGATFAKNNPASITHLQSPELVIRTASLAVCAYGPSPAMAGVCFHVANRYLSKKSNCYGRFLDVVGWRTNQKETIWTHGFHRNIPAGHCLHNWQDSFLDSCWLLE